ncbi:hypothetical protein [Arsenicicoccus dermatophilus]|uniref:hypothetical protein n=1 Tax=Arsenicicoccus dermatophilus TaxID=1076331 RepID=UPI001F4CD21A|nr:hypothetical protein [Arsenicicoccus dermatophilus]MCH8613459.1 hypothetical protein [Arsenicicoccus dermatophilus]
MTAPRKRRNPVDQITLEERALTLRARGKTYAEIADECGWKTRSAAMRAIDRALERSRDPGEAGRVRDIQALRMNKITAGHWDAAITGDPKAADIVMKAHDRIVDLYGATHAHGIAERQQALQETQATIVLGLITGALAAASVTTEQREAAMTFVKGELTRLDQTEQHEPIEDAEIVEEE